MLNSKCENFVDSTILALDRDWVRVAAVGVVELWVPENVGDEQTDR